MVILTCFSLINLESLSGEYIVSFLAKFLGKESEAKIIHDTRVIWNTIDMVNKYGGQTVVSRRARLREGGHENTDAIYGGEMSAHHYFRDFLLRQWYYSFFCWEYLSNPLS